MKKQDKSETAIKVTSIPGLLVIERPTFPDERGFFHEVFRLNELKEAGIVFKPVQWSHSRSLPGVIRAIHSEEWQKIVYPVNGEIFIAIADVRPDSSTFGKVETFEFNNSDDASHHRALFLPKGIGIPYALPAIRQWTMFIWLTRIGKTARLKE